MVLLADSQEGLPNALNALSKYCQDWKLNVNNTKTKVMVFSRKKKQKLVFTFDEKNLEVVNEYKYLGILFSANGIFYKARVKLKEQANRAMFSLLSKCRSLRLNVDVQIELFDKMILPIMLYASEVWGYENIDLLEKLRLKFCKYVLHVNASTPTCMVYGELGIFPVDIYAKLRMIKFWTSLLMDDTNKYSARMYKVICNIGSNLNDEKQIKRFSNQFKWFSAVKNILDNCGLSYVWLDQNIDQNMANFIYSSVKQCLKDQFIQKWYESVYDCSKCINYRIFKQEFGLEKYLYMLPDKYWVSLVKLRLSNSKLPIEVGRYTHLERHERFCNLCHSNLIGDEYHLVLECEALKELRSNYISRFYYGHPNTHKFKCLMTSENKKTMLNNAKFVKEAYVYVSI